MSCVYVYVYVCYVYKSCIYIRLSPYIPAVESLYSTKRDGYIKQKKV